MFLITFSTVTDALAAEAYAAEQGLGGEIISLPASLEAGCGFAYRVEAEDMGALERCLRDGEVIFEKILPWNETL